MDRGDEVEVGGSLKTQGFSGNLLYYSRVGCTFSRFASDLSSLLSSHRFSILGYYSIIIQHDISALDLK